MNPCPMLMFIVSPLYQAALRLSFFHFLVGMIPEASPGKSIPVLAPRPKIALCEERASMPVLIPIL